MTRPDPGPDRTGARGRRSRLRLALAAVVSLVLAGTSAQAMAAQPDARTGPPPVPSLAWSDCQGGFECANADVPQASVNPIPASRPVSDLRIVTSSR